MVPLAWMLGAAPGAGPLVAHRARPAGSGSKDEATH